MFINGIYAAAAAKAATIYASTGVCPQEVEIKGPLGPIVVKIDGCWAGGGLHAAAVVTKAGVLLAKASPCAGVAKIHAGRGVGVVKRHGLPVEVGDPAVMPGALELIKRSVEEVYRECVEIYIDFLGVQDIYITSVEGLDVKSAVEEAASRCRGRIGLALGNLGVKTLRPVLGDCVVEIGDDLAAALAASASSSSVKSLVLAGAVGKMVKVSAGVFQLRSDVADCRLEALALYAALVAGDIKAAKGVLASSSVEEALGSMPRPTAAAVVKAVAERAWKRVRERLGKPLCVVTYNKGDLIAWAGEECLGPT